METGERLDRVEARLGKVEDQVAGLRSDVDKLRTDVDGLRSDVDGLRTDVDGLRVLQEESARRIALIAEVQVHHGAKLDQLISDIEPLKGLPELLQAVIKSQERRITFERRSP